ncbi:hypothetical protein ACFSO0_07020 [Brevibacillus sp. GCM10020057]|uniref:hypothetical protein n=1 Tax=Brevibacillus sp. GCM10020057 TaxID=3317327 RepID=UPI00363FB5EE
MDALIDLLFTLLGWMIFLIGKFWLLILAWIGYKIFGKGSRKMAQGKPRRVLTPVENGGFPLPEARDESQQEPFSSRYEPEEPEAREESLEGVGIEQEWAYAEPDHSVMPKSERVSPPPAVRETADSSAPFLDPREGMKWAIIFGEPRAKAPHRSPAARRNE